MAGPLINRTAHSFSSIELRANTRNFFGFTALDYTLKIDREKVKGKGRVAYDWTDGIFEISNLTVTMLRNEYDAFLLDLGNGFMDKPFFLSASYSARSLGALVTRTDIFSPCKLKQDEHTAKEGPSALTIKVDIDCLWCKINGLDPIELSSIAEALLR